MEHKRKIEDLMKNASPEARKILLQTLKIERMYKWQTDHRGLTSKIQNDIMSTVKDCIK
jgi:hypothetical protein